jgi:ferrous iron transport protein B
MGITHENWPATVGLFTGLFAKETVISSLDALYPHPRPAGHAAGATNPASPPAEAEETFDFWAGIVGAFRAIPEGFRFDSGDEEAQPEQQELAGRLRTHFGTRYAAVAYLLFVLIYAPCIAAIAAIYRETNLRWMLFSVVYTTGLAWVVATLFYQAGTFARHPASSAFWLAVATLLLAIPYLALRLWARYHRRSGQ